MRLFTACVFSMSLIAFSGAASAQQSEQPNVTPNNIQNLAPGYVGESCFGDRYESDADMNEGNRITEEEIRRVLDPPRS
jgi:hypothetical protein